MTLFRSRPLALIISIAAALLFAGAFMPSFAKLLLMAAVLLISPVVILIIRRVRPHNICGIPAAAFVTIAAAIILCTLLTSFLYFNIYAESYEALDFHNIRCTVINAESSYAYGSVYAVRLQSVDGKPKGGKGLIYTDGQSGLSAGDIIEAAADFCPLDEFYDYENASRVGMLTDGFVFSTSISGEAVIVGESNSIEVRLSKFAHSLSAKLRLFLSSDTAAFADGLFLGNRENLGRAERDFKYLGVTHLLALSGLHLTVIYMGLDKLLRLLRISTRGRYFISFILIAFYTALTSFLMSVIRAAVMLMIAFASRLIRRDRDGVTGLFAALGIIMLFDPAAVYDVSLQLSFAATLGIQLMSGSVRELGITRQKKSAPTHRRVGGYMLSSMVAGFGATLFVLPLQWLYFGEVSLLAIPATLIFALICEGILLFIPPYLVCVMAGFDFLSGRLGYLIDILTKLCTDTAELAAQFSKTISLQYPFTLPIIILTAVIIILMSASGKFSSWLYAAIPFAISAVIFFGGVFIYDAVTADDITLDFKSAPTGDMVLAVSGGDALIIDASGGSRSLMREMYHEASDRCITEIDTVMLTRLNRRHVGAVERILSYRRVRRLLVPMPEDDKAGYLINDISEVCREYGTAVVLYDSIHSYKMKFGGLTLRMPRRTYLSRSDVPLTLMHFSGGERTLVYMGRAAWEKAFMWSYTEEADAVVFGGAGPKIKAPPEKAPYEAVKGIYILSVEVYEALSEWLSSYSGKIAYGDEIGVSLRQ